MNTKIPQTTNQKLLTALLTYIRNEIEVAVIMIKVASHYRVYFLTPNYSQMPTVGQHNDKASLGYPKASSHGRLCTTLLKESLDVTKIGDTMPMTS